jgi:hypothetical protein
MHDREQQGVICMFAALSSSVGSRSIQLESSLSMISRRSRLERISAAQTAIVAVPQFPSCSGARPLTTAS